MMWKLILFLFILYGAPIVFLLRKWVDISKHPAMYLKEIKGYAEYLTSRWYWPPRKSYTRMDPPGRARPTFSWLTLILIAFTMLFPLVCWELYIPDGGEGIIVYNTLAHFISIVSHSLLSVAVPYYLCLYSSKPQNISITIFSMNKQYRHYRYFKRDKLWREWTMWMIVLLIVSLILQMICLLSFGYLMDDQLVWVSPAGEKIFEINNGEMVSIHYDHVGNIQHYYLYNEQGDVFDVCGKNYIFLHKEESLIDYLTATQ